MKVPCFLCSDVCETEEKRVIAKVCDKCNEANLTKTLRNLTYAQVKKAINRMILTKDGELI